jgi:hypothetical protein
MKSKTTINVADFQNKTIVLLESSNTLDAVVSGTMETGDKARVAVLNLRYCNDGRISRKYNCCTKLPEHKV